MKITAALARQPEQDFLIEELDLEQPRADEVLVKIVGVGVCHSDLAGRDQHFPVPLPAVLGHEGAGVIEKVGSAVTDLKVGDHVVLSYLSCGHCKPCEEDHPAYCSQWPSLNILSAREDGSSALSCKGERVASHFFGQSSFAGYAIANQKNTIKVRKDAPLEYLGPLGCGIQTGAGSIMRALNCPAGSSLVVLGGGAVGLSAVMGAVVQQCNPIIVVEPMESRRQLALELGATHAIDPRAVQDLTAELLAIVPAGLDYAFDNTAIQSVMASALAALTSRGTLALVGVPKPDSPTANLDIITMLQKGISVVGITEGDANPEEFVPAMVDLFMDGKFPIDKMMKFYPLQQINAALQAQHDGSVVKAVLKPW